MIKAKNSHRKSFRKLMVETLQDRRLMAVDATNPLSMPSGDVSSTANSVTTSATKANDVVSPLHFASEAEATEALEKMASDFWNRSAAASIMNSLNQQVLSNASVVADRRFFNSNVAAASFSATDSANVQVAGVDESDNALFSDDGFAFVFRDQTIRIIDVRDPSDLKEVSRISLPGINATMHLVDDMLVVVGEGYQYEAAGSTIEQGSFTQLKFFDVTSKSKPVGLGGFQFSGSINVSRVSNGKLVLVQDSVPAVPAPLWMPDSSMTWGGRFESQQEYLDRVTPKLIESQQLAYQQIDKEGKLTSGGTLGDWRDIANVGGMNRTRIVTIDLASQTPKMESMESVLGGWLTNTFVAGNHVYLTDMQSEGNTRITLLDLGNSKPNAASKDTPNVTAIATGEVKGAIRNSRFMDEYDGYLRVVTTEDGSNSGGRIRNSANVFVLESAEGKLRVVGSLLDISPGDQAFGVEFDGTRAFVTTGFFNPVTFRAFDPLHGIDLSDPKNPKEMSDVVIPGVTNYVHWIDSKHLIGVGMIEENSFWYTKVSLYDVTDIEKPKTIDVWQGTSPVTPDIWNSINPLDFHYDPQSKTLTIPQSPNQFAWVPRMWDITMDTVQAIPILPIRPLLTLAPTLIAPIWNPVWQNNPSTTDVIVLSVDVEAKDPLTFRTFVGDGSGMGRSVVIGDTLVTLTNMYLATSSLAKPQEAVDRILLSNPLRPDVAYVGDWSESMTIDVLENDSRLVDFKITAIKQDTGPSKGKLEIRPDQKLQYTRPTDGAPDQQWYENFTYEVTTSDGVKFETFVTLSVAPLQKPVYAKGSALVTARAIDKDNKPVETVSKGDEFWVEIQVKDGRTNGQGVFSAYFDVAIDTTAFELVGDPERTGVYKNGRRGEKTINGWKDLGGFSDSPTPIGPETQSLVRFKVRALSDQAFRMTMSGSKSPGLPVALYGVDGAIDPANVSFAKLEIPQTPPVESSMASLGLKVYDKENKPVTSTAKGDEFWVEVTVQDGRKESQGVYSAYVDVKFDTKSFEIVGDTEKLGNFTNKASGIKTSDGWKNLGGFSNLTTPTGSGQQSLVRFKLRAIDDAELNMTVTPSQQAGFELTLFGRDTLVPIESIQAGSLRLPLTVDWDFDVNGDGILSALDSLMVINKLNLEKVNTTSAGIPVSSNLQRLDVTRDGKISHLDVLAVINRINEEFAAAMMNTVSAIASDVNEAKKKR